MFENTIRQLKKYENIIKEDTNLKDEYKISCAELDISKALVYDLGYSTSSNIARGMLILDPLNNILR